MGAYASMGLQIDPETGRLRHGQKANKNYYMEVAPVLKKRSQNPTSSRLRNRTLHTIRKQFNKRRDLRIGEYRKLIKIAKMLKMKLENNNVTIRGKNDVNRYLSNNKVSNLEHILSNFSNNNIEDLYFFFEMQEFYRRHRRGPRYASPVDNNTEYMIKELLKKIKK